MFIVRTVYNIILFILIPFIFPIGYLIAMKKGEDEDYTERFGAVRVPSGFKESIWIHCASVGEVRSINNLVRKIRIEFPELSIAISTTTFTGKTVAQQELKPDLAMLIPLENSMAISMLIDAMRCKAMFIVDTELWPNTIYTASNKTKLFMINGRISDKSFRSYKLLKFIFKPLLNKFDYIYAKSDDDVRKLSIIKGSNDNIENSGNLKFYFEPIKEALDFPAELKGKKIAMASCTHETEEDIFIEASSLSGDIFDHLVIAPRHLNRISDVIKILENFGLEYRLLSENKFDAKVILIDSFGQLERFYANSQKIFIGGSLDNTGGHNIFEAIQFGKRPSVGPNMHNFKEIYDLAKSHNAVATVSDVTGLAEYLKEADPKMCLDELFVEVAEKNKSTDKIIDKVKSVL